MGSSKAQRSPRSDWGSSSSASSAAPDVARGSASEGSFVAGLEANSPRGQANEVDVQQSRRLANEMTSLARRNAWAANVRGMQMRFRKARRWTLLCGVGAWLGLTGVSCQAEGGIGVGPR